MHLLLSYFRSIRFCRTSSLSLLILGLATYNPSAVAQEANNQPFAQATELSVQKGRALSQMLTKVEDAFEQPITFEKSPADSTTNLQKLSVATAKGPKTLLARPQTQFSVTLNQLDATPYLAANSVLSSYSQLGNSGFYRVVQQNSRVDIVPIHAQDSAGTDAAPVMSRSLSFPRMRRSLPDTVALITTLLSQQSGIKITSLNLPGQLFEQVELDASNESAADVIEKLGNALHRSVSFQCLHEPNEKAYYLVLRTVSKANAPGSTAAPTRVITPKTGPANSPFFVEGH